MSQQAQLSFLDYEWLFLLGLSADMHQRRRGGSFVVICRTCDLIKRCCKSLDFAMHILYMCNGRGYTNCITKKRGSSEKAIYIYIQCPEDGRNADKA